MDITTIPVFHPFSKVTSLSGTGDYCLFHGNLSVPDNYHSALSLIDEIFEMHSSYPLIIAGKNPPRILFRKARAHKNIKLIPNPSEAEMKELIQNAQLNILTSGIGTGMKLKVLHALYAGRYCIVNNAAVAGTGMEELCFFAENKADLIPLMSYLYSKPFTSDYIEDREIYLHQHFNNHENAKRIMQMIQ